MAKDKNQDKFDGELIISHHNSSDIQPNQEIAQKQPDVISDTESPEVEPLADTTPEQDPEKVVVSQNIAVNEPLNTPHNNLSSESMSKEELDKHLVPRDLFGIENDVETELQKTNQGSENKLSENSILVPGGINEKPLDPNKFFGSFYKKPHRTSNPYSNNPANQMQNLPTNQSVFGNLANSIYTPNFNKQNNNSALSSIFNKLNFKNNLLIITIGSILGVATLILVIIYGIIIPSKPENIYKSGLKNTSKLLDQLPKNVLNEKFFSAFDKQQINGTFESTASSDKIDGIISGKIDGKKVILKMESSNSDGASGKLVKAEYVIDPTERYPNVYYKANGMERIGGQNLAPMSQEFSNKWILADQAYFKSMDANLRNVDSNNEFGNLFDYSTANNMFYVNNTKVIINILQKYFTTPNNPNSVINYSKFLGKENLNGKKLYHYQIKLSKSNFGSSCKELVDQATSQDTYQSNTTNVEDVRSSMNAKCDVWADGIDEQQEHDLWIAKGGIVNKIKLNNNLGGYKELVLNAAGSKVGIGYNYQTTNDSFIENYNYILDYKSKLANLSYSYKKPNQTTNILQLKLNFSPSQTGIDNLNIPKADLLLKDIKPIKPSSISPNIAPDANPSGSTPNKPVPGVDIF